MLECPFCGSDYKPPEIRVDLNNNVAIVYGASVKLSPQCAEILFVFIQHSPHPKTIEVLIQHIYGKRVGQVGRPRLAILNGIHRLRKKLAEYKVEIWNVGEKGYMLYVSRS